jgi:ProP effector
MGRLTLNKPLSAAAQAAMARAAGRPIAPTPVPAPRRPAAAKPKKEKLPPQLRRKAIKKAMAAAHLRRAAWREEDLAFCQTQFPRVFNAARPLPLAIGIHIPLREALGGNGWRAYRLLVWWTAQPAYQRAVAAGGHRYNLDASVAGKVNAHQEEMAHLALAAFKEKTPQEEMA